MKAVRLLLLVLLLAAEASPSTLVPAAPPGPTISLSPPTLSIAAPAAGPAPAPSTLTLQNSGAGKLNWTAVSSAPWLIVSPTSGSLNKSASIDLAVSVSLTGLTSGPYTGTITFTDPAATNNPQSCLVTLQVTSSARIGLSPGALSFAAPEGGPSPPGQTVTLQNTGGGTLSWTASFSPTWLSSSSVSGTLSAGASQVLTLSADVLSLAAGSHTATMTVTAPGAVNTPQVLTVTLTISQTPVIGFSPAGLTFDAPQGGASPAPAALVLTNQGGGTLNWSAVPDAVWLIVSPASGSLTSGASAPLSVSVNTSGLAEGTYLAGIQLTASGAANTPQIVPVTLNVNAQPKIGINPKTLSFSVASDAPGSAAAPLSVTNTGSGTLTWTASAAAPWLAEVPAGGSLGSLASDPLLLSVNAAGLPPGHYTTTVQVSDPSALNSPQTVAVDLTVSESALPVHAPAGQCGLLGLELLFPGLLLIFGRRSGGTRWL